MSANAKPVTALEDHPAKFNDEMIRAIRPLILRHRAGLQHDYLLAHRPLDTYDVLDPFAGVGGIHALATPALRVQTWGIELEPEWAACHMDTVVGNATDVPYDDASFHAIVTSPCYGNRMADKYDGRDGSKRRTYRISLGRMPTEGSAAVMQWGKQYRTLHLRALVEMKRVLVDEGLLVVNMKDHYRTIGKERLQLRMHVCDWWAETIAKLGFRNQFRVLVGARGMRMGENHEARADHEELIVAIRPPR